jgi:hypothetical protein
LLLGASDLWSMERFRSFFDGGSCSSVENDLAVTSQSHEHGMMFYLPRSDPTLDSVLPLVLRSGV